MLTKWAYMTALTVFGAVVAMQWVLHLSVPYLQLFMSEIHRCKKKDAWYCDAYGKTDEA